MHPATPNPSDTPQPLFDCDVHHPLPTREEWALYAPERYKQELAEYGLRRIQSGIRSEDGGDRWDADCRSVESLQKQLLERYPTRIALLSGNTGFVAGQPDPEWGAALCSAYNDWTIENWSSKDERLIIGIKIPQMDAEFAVREIERLAGHPDLACIFMWGGAERIPFGLRPYWPIYEAAARHNLPIHVHPSTTTGLAACATSAAGLMTNYLQTRTCLPQFYQAHLVSLVLEGCFEKWPNLRFTFVEGGFGWLPHVLWRMDKEYKNLRQQAPLLKRLPSEYVKTNVKLSQQPMEEPSRAQHFEQLLDMMGGPEILCYASDFPHYDFDSPGVLPRTLSKEARSAILHDNASAWFRR